MALIGREGDRADRANGGLIAPDASRLAGLEVPEPEGPVRARREPKLSVPSDRETKPRRCGDRDPTRILGVGQVADSESGVFALDPLIILITTTGRIKDMATVGEEECHADMIIRALEPRDLADLLGAGSGQ
jgi:hypothetical protein